MFTQFRPALIAYLVFTILTGLLYPLTVTGIAHIIFPQPANGSLVVQNGKPVGSALIGQPFDAPKYFWGRPSATLPFPDNAAASSGSNRGPTNPALQDAVQARIAALQQVDPDNTAKIPVDLVTASASGLDPDISPAAAEYQVARVARARGVRADKIRALVAQNTHSRWLGLIGEPRVNVLELNLALDEQ